MPRARRLRCCASNADWQNPDDGREQKKASCKRPGQESQPARRRAARRRAGAVPDGHRGRRHQRHFAEFESHWLGNEVEGEKYLPAEAAFFRDVVSGVVRDQAKLDPLIDDALQKGWPLQRIDAILRAVLRAGSYELEHRKDMPGRVVVSEYVDVAHAFVEKDETGMVNAVLDQIARQFRADEFARG